MINISWLEGVSLSVISACVGILIYFFCERIGRKQKITEAREEIIQEAIDNADCFHKSENDADYSVDHKGTEAIHKILERVL